MVFSSFSIIIGFGSTLGLAWVAWRAPRQKAITWLEAGLGCLAGALIGARLGFVMVNWGYFQSHWIEIPQVWLGGLSGVGGILGGLVSLGGAALITRERLGILADALAPLAALLTTAAWLASWEAGAAYGIANPHSWWAVPAPDEWGTLAYRWPVQPLAAVLTLAVLGLVDQLRSYLRQEGKAASLTFAALAASWLGFSFVRADPMRAWLGWRLDTWAFLVFLITAAGLCLAAFWPRHSGATHTIEELPNGTL